MAIPFMNLPTPGQGVSSLLDFAPLAGALQGYTQGADRAQQRQNMTQIGQTVAGQGMGAGANQALQMGELDAGLQMKTAATGEEDVKKKRFGSMAQAVDMESDPGRRTAMWQGVLKRLGNTSGLTPEEMDPVTGPKLMMAEAGIVVDPVERDLKRAQAAKYRADARNSGTEQTRVGLQPVYGRDAQGNVVVLQPSASGQMIQSQVPEGVTLDPGLVAGAKAQATAAGKWEGGADQRQVGKERLTNQLSGMVRDYLTLNERGGIVNPDRPAMENLKARARSSSVGQAIGGAVGTEEQSIRNRVENVRPLLMQGIMQASGMSARALDSNRELDFYLRAATDPTQDIYSNLVAIDVLDKTYGMGGVLDGAVPPEILARVRTDAARAIESRPIPTTEPGAPQPPQGQAAPAAPRAIPPQAVQVLASDPSPEAIREFDEVFGAGSAQRVLNGR